MRIALIQDQLLTKAGSERVFLYMAQEFREADIFTFCYNPDTTLPEFQRFPIRMHPWGRVVRSHGSFKLAFPLVSRLMEHWDFSGYDVVLTSSATTAKYIRCRGLVHICYCYYPTRAIWEFDRYFGDSGGLGSRVFSLFMPYFKKRDYEVAQRVDRYVAISNASRDAIRRYYDRDADVLYCPVDLDRLSDVRGITKKDYFLLVSRLERWKLVDYAVNAFNRLGLPLHIIGKGPEEARLKAMAKSNIVFLGGVSDETLVRCYGEARAVVFTPELEYGLVPVEAIATGTPVIALGRGGVLETMVGVGDPSGRPATAVLFPDPKTQCLVDAIRRFEKLSFSPEQLVAHAATFGIPEFGRRLRVIVEESYAAASASETK